MSFEYTYVDLFCGAGGLSLGMEKAGFNCIYSADNWKPAVDTYEMNFNRKAHLLSVDWDTELPQADFFVGGPPCQGFSSAGRRVPRDARNSLVSVYAHLIVKHKPKGFVFENVEGFLTGDNGQWVLDLLSPLVHAGYCISLRKVNAANYGVPQHRKRVLVVGGLGWLPSLPTPTHKAFGVPGAELIGKELPFGPTVQNALDNLPHASLTKEEAVLEDHVCKEPNDDDKVRIQALLPGQTMKDLPSHLWHNTYKKRASRRVKDGTPTEKRGGAPAGLRRLDPRQPSKAITSAAQSEFIHPFEDRTLTLRECARLQTFPDDFVFLGTKSQRAILIGNAVPPQLAEVLGTHLFKRFSAAQDYLKPPGIYEFTPTFSTGMSPALRKTVNLIHSSLADFIVRDKPLQMSLFGV